MQTNSNLKIYLCLFLLLCNKSFCGGVTSFERSKDILTDLFTRPEIRFFVREFYCGAKIELDSHIKDGKVKNKIKVEGGKTLKKPHLTNVKNEVKTKWLKKAKIGLKKVLPTKGDIAIEGIFQTAELVYNYSESSKGMDLDWDHLVTANELKDKSKGCEYLDRQQCARESIKFKTAAADPHNLVPAFSSINRSRGADKLVLLSKGEKNFANNKCRIQKNKDGTMGVPGKQMGYYARTALYMNKKYKLGLSPKKKMEYEKMSRKFQPTCSEIIFRTAIQEVFFNGEDFDYGIGAITKLKKQMCIFATKAFIR